MPKRIAILHGAGYVGGELIRLLQAHPFCTLAAVTSRTFAGKPLWHAHPALRGQTELCFVDETRLDVLDFDAIFIAAEHGQGARAARQLLERGYEGILIDLSADFRFRQAAIYPTWFGFEHPAPDLLSQFVYGLIDVYAPYPEGTRLIANPGCFATGLALALWPISRHLSQAQVAITALTGASGSGTQPKATTHFPEREGNVRAYKVLAHQHLPEVQQVLGNGLHLAFVPASGPWTRGIWGTAILTLPKAVDAETLNFWFTESYKQSPLVRLWPGQLPELRYSVYTPFCDIGWVVRDRQLVVGFALDNLLKGAASQAIENLNVLLGLPQTSGLLPTPTPAELPT